jgi:hypothetical protein
MKFGGNWFLNPGFYGSTSMRKPRLLSIIILMIQKHYYGNLYERCLGPFVIISPWNFFDESRTAYHRLTTRRHRSQFRFFPGRSDRSHSRVIQGSSRLSAFWRRNSRNVLVVMLVCGKQYELYIGPFFRPHEIWSEAFRRFSSFDR